MIDCGLEDDDLEKIVYRLMEDKGIRNLRLGQNLFTSLSPFIELFKVKGQQYRQLDISGSVINAEAIQEGFIQAMGCMKNLDELNISGCLADMRSSDVKKLIDTICLGITDLRQLDISKNSLTRENFNHFFKLLQQNKSSFLECLALSQVNLPRESLAYLINAVQQMSQLRKLNISGNEKITGMAMQQILRGLISHQTIEDLDISMTGINNDYQTLQLIGELIQTNKSLKSLNMKSLGLTDQSCLILVDPLEQSLNMQTLNFDSNNLGAVFIQSLVNKYIMSRQGSQLTNQAASSPKSQASSLMTDETNSNGATSNLKNLTDPAGNRAQGLISMSFEGNVHLGDQGAAAISTLIQTQNPFSNNLRVVNLNECGITNTGFEHLKQALRQRATMANNLDLTHVKITIERNNIEQINE